MSGGETPPLSLHFTALGVNPIPEGDTERHVGFVQPTLCIKRDNMDPKDKIDTDPYNAYTGQDTTLQNNDRVKAESQPDISIRLNEDEGLEDLLYLFTGHYDTPVAAITGATIAKKWKIYRDVSNPVELPWATIVDAFNWGGGDADAWINAFANTIKISSSSDKAPVFEVGLWSDYRLSNQDVPTRVFATDEFRFKANQCQIFMGPAGTSEAALEADTYKVDCYTEQEFNANNNMESKACGGATFGTVQKNRKPLTSDGSVKMDYNEKNRGLLAEYSTGSSDGVYVTEESVFKSLLIKFIGKKIETVSGTPATDVHSSFALYLPKVELTDVTSPRSGDATKDITVNYAVVSNAQVTQSPIQFTLVTPADDIHWGTIPS